MERFHAKWFHAKFGNIISHVYTKLFRIIKSFRKINKKYRMQNDFIKLGMK